MPASTLGVPRPSFENGAAKAVHAKEGLRMPSTRRRGCEGRPRAALGADRASHGGRARSAPDCVSGLRRSSSKDAVDLRCSDGRISSLSPPSGAQIFIGRQNAPGTSDHIWNAHRCSTGRVRCAQQLPAHPALRSSQHDVSIWTNLTTSGVRSSRFTTSDRWLRARYERGLERQKPLCGRAFRVVSVLVASLNWISRRAARQ